MKINKKRMWAIGLSVTAVAAAIAIPVGIVYGVKPQATATVETTRVISKADSLSAKYTFGTSPATIAAPELNETDFKKEDYQAGIFKESNITDATEVGDKKAKITFEYRPIAGKANLPVIHVIYFVDTQKGTVAKDFGTAGVTAAGDVPVGIDTFAKVEASPVNPSEKWIDKWIRDNAYIGYKLKASTDTAKNPSYTKADNSALSTEADLKALTAAVTTTAAFKAEYKFEIDTVRFNNSTPAAVAEGKLTVSYTVKTAATYAGKTAYEDAKIAVKAAAPTDFVPTALPEASATGAANFEIDATSTAYEIAAKANDGTGAWVGDKITNLNAVNTYGAGTEITAHFYFKPKATFAGNYIHTTKKLVIDKDTAATFTDTKPTVTIEYGKFDGKVPATPDAAVKGYATKPSSSIATVKAKSAIAGDNSPASGTKVTDWTTVVNWNPGTVIEIVHSYDFDTNNYVPATGKTTVPGVITQTVTIDKQKNVVVPDDSNQPISEYKMGTDVEVLKILDASKNIYDAKLFEINVIEWYVGATPDPSITTFNKDFSSLKTEPVNYQFTVRFEIKIKEDFAESSNAKRTSFYYRQPYKVVANS